MEIAGSTCSICQRRVVLAIEGKFCPCCGSVVHLACEPGDACGVCGRSFQRYERPSIDPTQDAIVPRALRTGSGGPVFVALAGVVAAVVVIVIIYALLHALSQRP